MNCLRANDKHLTDVTMADSASPPLNFPLLLASLFLGLFCLFPYNSFLSSPTYLEHYYQYAAVKSTDNVADLPQTSNTSFWGNVSNWATVMMLVPMALMQCVMMTPVMLRLNVQLRMILGAILLLIAMLLMPVCAAGGGVSESGSIAIVLIACFLTGGATSLLQSSSYALFGTLPTMYVTFFILGGGLSGTANSLLRIIIHYALPTTFSGIKKGAVVFYTVNMALMALTVLILVLLRYNVLVKECCRAYSLETGVLTDPALVEVAGSTEASCRNEPTESGGDEAAEEKMVVSSTESVGDDSSWSVTKRIWLMMLGVFLTMCTTLTYFPGFGLHAMKSDDSSDDSSSSDNTTQWKKESVMPMVIILMYNAGDTIGRCLPNFPRLWLPKKGILFLMVFRIVACLIPLVLGVVSAKVINSNANPIVVFLFLGLTNGYLVGTMFAYGCSDDRLKTESEHATAGTCMAFALLIGCCCGSVLALILVTCAL